MYLADWKETGLNGLLKDFEISEEVLKGSEILLAYYYQDNDEYVGNAVVLFRRDSSLWLVIAGHCSCYGLEEQWEPEETSIEALKQILTKGSMFEDIQREMADVIKSLES